MWFFSVIDEKSVNDAAFPDCSLVHQLVFTLQLFDHNKVQAYPTQPQNLKVVGIYNLGNTDKNMVQTCPELTKVLPTCATNKESKQGKTWSSQILLRQAVLLEVEIEVANPLDVYCDHAAVDWERCVVSSRGFHDVTWYGWSIIWSGVSIVSQCHLRVILFRMIRSG